MSDQVVQYELSLKDGLSTGIDKAEGHANKLEHTMHSLGERVTSVAEAFGISFAIFKGIEFVHEGIEEMEKLHKAEAAVQNTMENMGAYTQEAFEKMVAGAKEASQSVNYTQADILGLQSQLGLVGNIGEKEMGRITQASADLATKMGTGLEEAGNLLAKAINAPEMARRLGMALKIDPAVMEHIQNLAKHGHEAQARLELLAITEAKVGGAAAAAFNADPLARFNKIMLDVKQEVGALAISALRLLVPALEWVGNAFKTVSTWIKQNMEFVKALAIGVGVAAVAWGVYTVVQSAAAIGLAITTAAQWALNAAMDANPIGIVIIALAAMVTAIVYAYEHIAKFRADLWGTWEVIKEFGRIVGDVFMGVGKVIAGALTLSPSLIKEGFNQTLDAVTNAGNRLGHAFKTGYDEGMADFNASQAKEKESLIPKKGTGAKVFPIDKPKEPKIKATGSRTVTINVHIQDLVKTFNVNTTNLKQGAVDVKNAIVNALTDATNDFQIVADH